MLPREARIGGVRLQVADLSRSLDYYTGVLGLRVIEASAGVATLGAPDAPGALVTLEAVEGTRRAPRGGASGLFHFAILLPDRAALGRFVAHLASRRVPAGMSDHTVSESIYLTDPDGLGIEVYADRPRGQWPRVGDQIVMTTDPLDVADLVATGAGRPWSGMPAGTTMGHVHLHVGDLERGEAFYRRALGFDVTVRNYPGALFFSAGGYHHHLATNTWSDGPGPGSDQARLLEWTLVVPSAADADVVGRRLVQSGHPAVPGEAGWTVADPWGTPLRISSA
jgi:catechol 2,3-dioxygenase